MENTWTFVDSVSPFQPFQYWRQCLYITANLNKLNITFTYSKLDTHKLEITTTSCFIFITTYSCNFGTPSVIPPLDFLNCCHTHDFNQPLNNSFWICHNAGWCHSVLLFNTGILHLLISTASLAVYSLFSLPALCFFFWPAVLSHLLTSWIVAKHMILVDP